MDKHSWVLRSDGTIFHNGENIASVKESPVEGDIIVRQQYSISSHVLKCVILIQ